MKLCRNQRRNALHTGSCAHYHHLFALCNTVPNLQPRRRHYVDTILHKKIWLWVWQFLKKAIMINPFYFYICTITSVLPHMASFSRTCVLWPAATWGSWTFPQYTCTVKELVTAYPKSLQEKANHNKSGVRIDFFLKAFRVLQWQDSTSSISWKRSDVISVCWA